MNFNKFALTLTAATLLPAFAFAATDEVAASFERDLHRAATAEPQNVTALNIARNGSDPLDIINAILNREPDTIVASFDRDLNREPTTPQTVLAGAGDPLVEAINIALYSSTDQVLASFERDLKREPVTGVAVVNDEVDPLVKAITVALGNDTGKPVVHAEVASNHRHGS